MTHPFFSDPEVKIINPQPFFTYSQKDQHILFHATRPVWLKLNDSALNIATNLANAESAASIAKHLVKTYQIPFQSAQQDVSYVLNQLQQHRFLFTSSEISKREPFLNWGIFHLTTRCNLKCPHCYIASQTEQRREKALPFSLVCKLIDELIANGGKNLTLTGGEPFLYPEIRKLIEHAADLKIDILTNGTLINKAWAAFLADHQIAVQISLDGSVKEIHDDIRGSGSFDKVMKAIAYLQDAGMGSRLTLCTTIMQQNLHDLFNILSLAKRLGIPQLRFLPLRKVGNAKARWNQISGMDLNAYEAFFEHISNLQRDNTCEIDLTCGLAGFLLKIPKSISEDDIWCPVGKRVVVDTNGDAYPCVLMMDNRFRLGNVFSQSLLQLIHSEKMAYVCDALATRRYKIETCAECNWRNFCQAGCMGQALDHKGTVWDTDNFCHYRQIAYQKAFDKILKS